MSAPDAAGSAHVATAASEAKPLDVAVVGGAGHVGLPLSLTLADAGMRVGIYDIAASTLDRIGRGELPFVEAGADELLRRVLQTDRLELSTDPAIIGHADTIFVVIGTPIDEFLNPSMTIFDRTVTEIAPHLRDGSLVILRSTVYPGTTAYVTRALGDRGARVDVAFCPERIAEGYALEEIRSLPQIIGADDPQAGDRAEHIFLGLGIETIRTTTKEAELAKLLTNTWRYTKFAVANQFFMIAHEAGVNYNNVLHAVRHNYPRARDLPGPGFAAGPCLLKDTMQLAAFTSDHFPMGHSAMQINEGLPAYLVAALERRLGPIAGRRVAILGMAFKAESDDPRASLSYKLRKLLVWAGAEVLCTDPYVRDERLVPLGDALRDSEIVIIGAPHRVYVDADLHGHEVLDIWGITGRGIHV